MRWRRGEGCGAGLRDRAAGQELCSTLLLLPGISLAATCAGGLPPDEVVETTDAALADAKRLIEAYHDPGRWGKAVVAVGRTQRCPLLPAPWLTCSAACPRPAGSPWCAWASPPARPLASPTIAWWEVRCWALVRRATFQRRPSCAPACPLQRRTFPALVCAGLLACFQAPTSLSTLPLIQLPSLRGNTSMCGCTRIWRRMRRTSLSAKRRMAAAQAATSSKTEGGCQL